MYLWIWSLFWRETPSIQGFRVRRCLYTANSGYEYASNVKKCVHPVIGGIRIPAVMWKASGGICYELVELARRIGGNGIAVVAEVARAKEKRAACAGADVSL
jgi:hypothetical protein